MMNIIWRSVIRGSIAGCRSKILFTSNTAITGFTILSHHHNRRAIHDNGERGQEQFGHSDFPQSSSLPQSFESREAESDRHRHLYGDLEFSLLPPPPLSLQQNQQKIAQSIALITTKQNEMDLWDTKQFKYALQPTRMQEWSNLCKGVRKAHIEARNGESPLILPAIQMHYTAKDGQGLLWALGCGLAKEAKADFLAISSEALMTAVQFLRQQAQQTVQGTSITPKHTANNSNSIRSRSSKLMLTPKYPHLLNEVALRPASTALKYLKYLNYSQRQEQLLYIYLYSNAKNSLHNDLKCEILKFAAMRDDLFVVLADTDEFNPLATAATMDEPSIDDFSGQDYSPLNNQNAPSSPPPPHLLAIQNKFLQKLGSDILSREGAFWLVDEQNSLLRIIVSPPTHSKEAMQRHTQQIRLDSEQAMVKENVRVFVRVLRALNGGGAKTLIDLMNNDGLRQDSQIYKLFSCSKFTTKEALTIILSLSSTSQTAHSFAEALKQFQANRKAEVNSIPGLRQHKSIHGDALKDLNKHEAKLATCIISPGQTGTGYDEIGALSGAKELLYNLIHLRNDEPHLFTKGILKQSIGGILLFGPPGTGKTMLARAVASQAGSSFISIGSSQIFDMYVGEGEKNVRALFSLARKCTPCIIFVDEIDAILDSRMGGIGRPSRLEVINEFMAEWDGILGGNEGIIVMGATNRPFALDDAAMRRLSRRILIDLPDCEGRRDILEILLRDDRVKADLGTIAEMTENYSGSDLKNVCMSAAMSALLRTRNSKNQTSRLIHNQNISQKQDHQSNGSNDGDDPFSELDVVIEMRDFEEAIVSIPASVSDQMLTVKELRKWDRQYGEGKGKPLGRKNGHNNSDMLGF